jgi:diaminohydroxyphosphoribosylaminopyrimidine deaminase/5-amino-6-(5-phosphoribosylamino)uracil reductase
LDSLGNGVTESGGYYSKLLQEYDAVIMSSSLFRESFSADSLPLSQEPGANQPIRIIVHKDSGSSNKIPLVNNKVNDKVIIFTDCRETTASEEAQQGIETVSLDEINLDAILDYCNRQGLCSVLLDMRGNFNEYEELVKEGIKKKYINKFVTEILPVWNGCTQNDPLLQLKNLDQGVKVEILRSMASAQSVVVEGYLNLK